VKSLLELEDALNTQRARADLAGRINISVVEEYERRRLEIAAKESELNEKMAVLESMRQEIKRIEDLWLEKLHALIETIASSFSAAFDRKYTPFLIFF
jgi:chromosome segregation ATPase